MKILSIGLICLLSAVVCSQQLRVGIFRENTIKRITISYNQGNYSLFADTLYLGELKQYEFVDLVFTNNKVQLKKGTTELGVFERVVLLQENTNSSLTYKPVQPALKARKYEHDIEVKAGATGLTLVNLVELDTYLKGVVESEGGGGKHIEYYKVQALMSRTYALKYLGKHKKEGFDLCDRVHCQAYHSMLRFTPKIDSAVNSTSGTIMTDHKGELVDAYFHANCGGQTSEPQYIWNSTIPYLNSFQDTFCIYTKQANWEKRVSKERWLKFLVDKYNYPIQDSLFSSIVFTFSQPSRMAFYIDPVLGIPLRDLREEFNLKSTFFSCYPDGDDVLIKGRGFGHGVGLCQEGAMKMAVSGFDYSQIARFYFPGIELRNMNEKLLFNQKRIME